MTLTRNPHDSFRWLAARVILLSATPTLLLGLTVCSLLLTAYGSDAQRPFGALVRQVVSTASSWQEAVAIARNAFPAASILMVHTDEVLQHAGPGLTSEATANARQLARTLGNDAFAMHPATPPMPGTLVMVAAALPAAPSDSIVVILPLDQLFPQLEFAWGMSLTVAAVLTMLLVYNSLVFSGYVQQKLSSEELRRRALERRMVEANRLSSLGTLAAGIAHEINNPLSIMTQEAGWLEDLTEDDLPAQELAAKVRLSAQAIRTQGARCRDITHNLLRLSRQGVVETAAVDVNAVTGEVAALSRHRCTRQSVALYMELDRDLPAACAAQAHVQQILLNLVANALDAMQDQAGGTLTLRTWHEAERVFVAVADTGPGMNEAVRARIFEPFFTTKPAGKGTGLGLAICYGLARRNNGALSVRSREGDGSTFILSLPVMLPDDDMTGREGDDSRVFPPAHAMNQSQGEIA